MHNRTEEINSLESTACPFKELAKELAKETGKDIDIDKGWGLFLPINLKKKMGTLPKNVFYTNESFPFAAPLYENYILNPHLPFGKN